MENTTQNSYHTHISSKHNALELKLDEVWRYRDLILLFTKRNFVVRYKQTILGPAWILLNPLFSSIIYAIVFGGIAKIGTEGIPTILFYLCSNAICCSLPPVSPPMPVPLRKMPMCLVRCIFPG